MIVEDDEIIREGLELALRQEGCRVYTAGAAGFEEPESEMSYS